jgi:4-amino-4-deoxy-L-arabinose transferase-like glycosyltransferase
MIVRFRCGHAVWLTGLALFYLLVSLLWHRIDDRPPRWDESHYLTISQHSYHALQRGDVLGALSLRGVTSTKSGLVPFLSALSYFVVGDSEVTATLLVNFASMLLLFHVLLAASHAFTGRRAPGAIAALLFCNLPLVAVWCRYYQVDLPLTALVCYTVWLCVAIDRTGFADRGAFVRLAVAVALGFATKHLFVACVLPPLLLLCIRAVGPWRLLTSPKRKRGDTSPSLALRACEGCSGSARSQAANAAAQPRPWGFFLLLAAGVALGGAYHLLNLHVIKEHLARTKDFQLTGGWQTPLSAWACFLLFLANWGWSPTLTLTLAAVSTLLLLAQGRWRVAYLVSCLAGGVAGVAWATSYPLTYYFLPLAPFLCLLGVAFLGVNVPVRAAISRPLEYGRAGLVGACLLLLGTHYSGLTLGTGNLARVVRWAPRILFSSVAYTRNPLVKLDYWTHAYVDGNLATLPHPHHYPTAALLDDIAAEIDAVEPVPSRKYRLGEFMAGWEWMSHELLEFKVRQRNLEDRLEVVKVPTPDLPDASSMRGLYDYDFLFLKSGNICKNEHYEMEDARQRQAYVDRLTADDYRLLHEARFTLARRYPLPDGTEGTLWLSPNLAFDVIKLADRIAEATKNHPDLVTTTRFQIGADGRDVLFQHPVAPPGVNEICWKDLPVAPGARLQFGVTISPETWQPGQRGDGVEFVAEVARDGHRTTLFRRYIDPKNDPADRHWFDADLSLEEFAGGRVDVILTTLPGPEGNIWSDHAGWSGLRIVSPR